mmetsp:Transcript_32166/g.73577  ORF Transcript_32166/g.73577 Transcript_32166/m.73577 type:complete len:190 (-) Transcript_32166:72-641(-)
MADCEYVFGTAELALQRYAAYRRTTDETRSFALVRYHSKELINKDFLRKEVMQIANRESPRVTLLLSATGKSYLWFDERENPGTTSLMEVLEPVCDVRCVVFPTTTEERARFQAGVDLATAVGGRSYEVWHGYSPDPLPQECSWESTIVVPEQSETEHSLWSWTCSWVPDICRALSCFRRASGSSSSGQ